MCLPYHIRSVHTASVLHCLLNHTPLSEKMVPMDAFGMQKYHE